MINKRIPIYTIFIALVCVILFIALAYYSNYGEISIQLYDKFGAPNANLIYNQHLYYGVITNSLVHENIWHLTFNLIIFCIFGSYIERKIPTARFIIFGIYFSMITSLWQLSISSDPGIGLSGVNMSIIGFIYGKGIYDRKFQIKWRKLLLICGILTIIICMLYDVLFHENIGNSALISGLLCGIIVGIFSTKSLLQSIIALSILAVISLSTLFYSPWSSEWNFAMANKYHKTDIVKARSYYERTLEINPNNQLAKENLYFLKLDDLNNKAFEAHSEQNYALARKYYLEILSIDKDNKEARMNIQSLP